MWNMLWPIGIVVCANTFYNICTKSTPSGTNAFLGLCVTYLVAAALALLLFFLTARDTSLVAELKKVHWSYLALGVVLLALEFGYICVYRAGWQVNTAPLVANIVLAVVLVFVGLFCFGEALTLKKCIGILVCAVGVVLVSG